MEGYCNVYTHSSLWIRPTRPDRYNAKMVYTTIYYTLYSRKFKGGIYHDGHLAITYGGQLLYLQTLLLLSSPSNFIKCVLSLLRGLKSCTYRLLCSKQVAVIICTDCTKWSRPIQRYNNSPSMHDSQNGHYAHDSIRQCSQKETQFPV